jgi:CheY-like chemotaxis protein
MTGDKQAALAAGFDDYIAKPIDTKTFSHTVARVLGTAA